MRDDDIHGYEPAQGHGLRHDPFNAIVARSILRARRRGDYVEIVPEIMLKLACGLPR